MDKLLECQLHIGAAYPAQRSLGKKPQVGDLIHHPCPRIGIDFVKTVWETSNGITKVPQVGFTLQGIEVKPSYQESSFC